MKKKRLRADARSRKRRKPASDAGTNDKEWTAEPCPYTILSRKGTIISNETDEERTCLLGGGAGRSPIDRVIGLTKERKGLFYLLTLESIGFVATEDENFDFLMPFRS